PAETYRKALRRQRVASNRFLRSFIGSNSRRPAKPRQLRARALPSRLRLLFSRTTFETGRWRSCRPGRLEKKSQRSSTGWPAVRGRRGVHAPSEASRPSVRAVVRSGIGGQRHPNWPQRRHGRSIRANHAQCLGPSLRPDFAQAPAWTNTRAQPRAPRIEPLTSRSRSQIRIDGITRHAPLRADFLSFEI